MFSKGSKASDKTPEAPLPPEDLSQRGAAIVTADRGAGVPSIISADLKIVGDLHSSGDLQIDGAIEGNISSRSLTIGESAVVRGTLVAETVRVYGEVFGEVKANAVTLAKTAKVEGDITHQSLTMEAGADLIGRLTRLETKIGGGARPAEKAANPAPVNPASANPASKANGPSSGS
jgi:cytoskeletal protein CcmA (bactofilin family)